MEDIIFKHKKTGSKLKLLKKRDFVSTFLKIDEPKKQFWNSILDNRVICSNINVEPMNSKMTQGILF